MVGHQHIGMDRQPVFGCSRREPVAVAIIIVLGKEDRLAIIAALDHMQRLIGNEEASEPGHDSILA